MKTRKRTPRKVLSLLLCVLMVATSVVFANPFTAKAATTITHTPRYSSANVMLELYAGYEKMTTISNIELPYYNSSAQGNIIFIQNVGEDRTAVRIYDSNPNAVNYEHTYLYKSGSMPLPTTYVYATTSPRLTNSAGYIHCGFGSESPNSDLNVITIGINTTNMIAAYDNAMQTIGKVNTEHYTENTWNNYIRAVNKIEYYINSGIHPTSETDDLQAKIYASEQALKTAIKGLTKAEVSLGNIFKQVDGATLSGPDKVYVGEEFEATVKLQEGYTQSVPTLTVTSGGTTNTVTGTIASDGSYKFKVTLTSEDGNSITPANVNKNTYKVTVPPSGTGFTASKTGTVTHGENYTFTVTLANGYTQTLPVVKAGTVTLGATPQGNNTYSYTITGVKADTTVSINGVTPNTYTVGYSLGEGVSKASDSASSIKHNGTATVKINVGDAYSQVKTLPISVTNGSISGGTRSGNTFTYTLSGVTADTTVKVTDLAKNKYTVTVPTAIGLTVSNTGSHTMTYGDSFTFTVTKNTGYTQATPVVKVNDVEIAGVPSDNTYTYTITNITENKNVTTETFHQFHKLNNSS